MAATAEATRQFLETLVEAMRAVNKRSTRRGTRASVTLEALEKAIPNTSFLRLYDDLVDAIKREGERRFLSYGPHGINVRNNTALNQAYAALLTMQQGHTRGPRGIPADIAVKIEQELTEYALDSHHPFEWRIGRDHYNNELSAYWKDGTVHRDKMIGVTMPRGLHRGVSYSPIEPKGSTIAALRDKLPAASYNLSDALQKSFPNSYFLSKPPLPEFLYELARFYKQNLDAIYDVNGPDGTRRGLLPALKQIAVDTGHTNIVWP